jgi:hypothetical protein
MYPVTLLGISLVVRRSRREGWSVGGQALVAVDLGGFVVVLVEELVVVMDAFDLGR